jgi:hypothetical protein
MILAIMMKGVRATLSSVGGTETSRGIQSINRGNKYRWQENPKRRKDGDSHARRNLIY